MNILKAVTSALLTFFVILCLLVIMKRNNKKTKIKVIKIQISIAVIVVVLGIIQLIIASLTEEQIIGECGLVIVGSMCIAIESQALRIEKRKMVYDEFFNRDVEEDDIEIK